MIRVSVLSQKDSDYLAINWAPWWLGICEFLIHRLTPCCGVTGWISRWEWAGDRLYDLSNWLTIRVDRHEKERFRVPIENTCVAVKAIWPESIWDWCWRDDCPVHPEEVE